MDTSGNDPSYLRTIIIGIVILVVVAGLLVMTPSYGPQGKDSQPPFPTQVTVQAVTKTIPIPSATTLKIVSKTMTKGTARPNTQTTALKTSVISPAQVNAQIPEGGASQTFLPATRTPPQPDGPKDFAITVSPGSARAPAGGRIVYTAHIEPKGDFSDPITLKIHVTAPFYDKIYDLGTLSPPYPKTLEYPFDVPGYVPGGIQITGVIQAGGGGKNHEQTVYLTVT